MSRHRHIVTALAFIADIVEQADLYLSESLGSRANKLPERKGLQVNRRDMFSRIDRRIREKMVPLTRNVLRARRERKARSRYATMKTVKAPPKKILSTRFRNR
jgi:hypothetical protein